MKRTLNRFAMPGLTMDPSSKRLWNLMTAVIFLLFGTQSCNNDDETYGPELEITGCHFTNYSANYDYLYSDTIPANSYQIALSLQSDNEYALEYGINPKVKNTIESINIETLDGLNGYALPGTQVNRFFLVEDETEWQNGYRTIDDFVANDGMFSNLTSGRLIFTNQNQLTRPYENIVAEGDTISCRFRLTILFNNQLTEQQTLNVTLTGNHEY
jgi:hypothetical protein